MGSATAKPLALKPPGFADRAGQDVTQMWLGVKGTFQHIEATARILADAVKLVAHVLIKRTVSFDKNNVLEVEQWIGKRDLTANPTDLVMQRTPRGYILDRRIGDGTLQFLERCFKASKGRFRPRLQVGE